MNSVFVPEEEIRRQLETAEIYGNRYPGGKYRVECFGCQQNEADAERIAGIAEAMGYVPAEGREDADLIVINTCAVREHAELRALSNTGGLKKLKKKNPGLIIAVCGCMAQEQSRTDRLMGSYPYVDIVFGTDRIHTLPELVSKVRERRERIFAVTRAPHSEFGNIAEGLPAVRPVRHRAWLSVMYGCDNFCSYCIVPYVRGRERSRRERDVLDEARAYIADGAKEITLLGQNVNSYRGEEGFDFPSLLLAVCELEGDFRVRFMTSHPKDCSDRLIEACRHPKAAPHIHLPFQSGSDRILKLMNRHYTVSQYLERVETIRRVLPDAALTTDVICGFPGETESDFEGTLEVVRQSRFDMIFTFLYSPRPGTRAAEMEDQVPHEVKVRRFGALSELENSIARENNEALVGSVQRVLCDEAGEICTGRSGQNKPVSFTSASARVGEFTDVVIKSAEAYRLCGEEK